MLRSPAPLAWSAALVAKLVRAHDGVIEFQSKPGVTRFTVLLPISDNQTNEGGS